MLRDRALDRLLVRHSRCSLVEGIEVCVHANDGEYDAVLAKVGAALRLIGELDPRRLERLRQDVRSILVIHAGQSAFGYASRLMQLDLPLVTRGSAGMVAIVIVHEAAHARLAAAGIITTRHTEARIERRCVLEQIAFMRLLEEAGWRGLPKAMEQLTAALSAPWWTKERRHQRELILLSQLGFGPLFVRSWSLLSRPRGGRAVESRNRSA